MMRRFVLICMAAGLMFQAFAQEENCKLKKSSDGIQIYACKSDNDKFKSLKAEFIIQNSSMDKLVALLNDVASYPEWQYNMESAEILFRESDENMITRSVIDVPWPVENRELIVRYQIVRNRERDELHVTAKTLAYDYPTSKGLVRIPFSHAEWIVKRSGASLKVNYTLRVDPGGSVPVWLVNMGIAEGPYHTFTNLRKKLEK